MSTQDADAVARLAEALAEIPGIRLGFLFGSRARGRARKDSDFDIAVLVTKELAREERGKTIRRLAARLGREVSSERLDIVILNDAPALLRHRVLRDGTLLFQSSPEDEFGSPSRPSVTIKTASFDARRSRSGESRGSRKRLKLVDREIFSRRLEALHGYLEKLKAFLDADEEEFVREPALHDLAERYLHLAVEACLDLANHWISDRALPTSDANRDTFTTLECIPRITRA